LFRETRKALEQHHGQAYISRDANGVGAGTTGAAVGVVRMLLETETCTKHDYAQ
jgi:hypothetical protein